MRNLNVKLRLQQPSFFFLSKAQLFDSLPTLTPFSPFPPCNHTIHPQFPHHQLYQLDYDLAERETGYDVLVYMVEHGNYVKHINIHSDHSIGVPKMTAYVQEHFPNTELTFNPV